MSASSPGRGETSTESGIFPQTADVLLIAGPTGSGKTEVAMELGDALQAPVVVADRIQCYVDLPSTSARFTDGANRFHLSDRIVPDGDYPPLEAAQSLLNYVQTLTRHHQRVVIEGGSISVLSRFARHRDQFTFRFAARVLELRGESTYLDRLRDRALRMLGDGMLDEFAAAWQHTSQRRFVASINGFEALVQWCEQTETDPRDLAGITLDEPVAIELAQRIAQVHAEHGHEQYAAFTDLFG
ncbi:isopentenyl transferase family protein [Nocardia sp. NBC_00565]|uniref:isopentenyl transferase family protein n=1 Tax=Nocardia sp. NBC_00565 TaxID=2975993 RepID=UPI002E80F54A|nr:isopentenyl transferase family protein [Nocardia sp. NBC_00565]WUC07533.1 isopentenyl transferase family protein [Nocardia sp. NBC_00565]